MTPLIRDADEGDLPAITALYGREVLGGTATFETTPPTFAEMAGRFAAVKRHGLPWLVAEIDGRFAGYAYASPFRPRPAYRYGVEGSIYVEEAARGHGVGRSLLVALVDRARAMGLRHVIGAISDSDTSAASIALHGRWASARRASTARWAGSSSAGWTSP
jgi:phosphinothricin acetyltransferase